MLKDLFLNLLVKISFINEYLSVGLQEAKKQGSIEGFRLAQKDILETMRDDIDVQAEELAKEKLKALLTPVNMKNVVSWDKLKGIVYVGGEKIDEARLANLHSEAEFFLNSDLWSIIHDTAKRLAEISMFEKGESIDDMKKGRSILFTLDSQRDAVNVFKSYTQKAK